MGTGLFQPAHLLLILFLVLLIVGPGRLTQVGRMLGESWRELRAGFRAGTQETPSPAAMPPLAAQPCPGCGVWSADAALYCTRCGTRLG